MKQPDQIIIPIRAAVLRTPGRPLKIERLEMEDPRDDEVLVRLVASGICHTDIDFCESGDRHATGDAISFRDVPASCLSRIQASRS
jgi:D-arabinose 1-dehydrogenase-like Zn-dependent alcohol dehydrogenase